MSEASAVRPAHTMLDGDTIFGMSTGGAASHNSTAGTDIPASLPLFHQILAAGADCFTRAIDQVRPGRLMGCGAVLNLSDFTTYRPIGADMLGQRDPGLREGDIAILRTDWTDRKWGQHGFLTAAPFLTGDGAQWLVSKGVKAVVYDFPEEEIIRKDAWDGKDAIVHHAILGNDIYNIEYVINLARLTRPFVGLLALPLPLAGLDGSPARVLAFEDDTAIAFLQSAS